ncbi:hypothetical protein HDU98_002598, partial [Podochytrium sp. JEL0797]
MDQLALECTVAPDTLSVRVGLLGHEEALRLVGEFGRRAAVDCAAGLPSASQVVLALASSSMLSSGGSSSVVASSSSGAASGGAVASSGSANDTTSSSLPVTPRQSVLLRLAARTVLLLRLPLLDSVADEREHEANANDSTHSSTHTNKANYNDYNSNYAAWLPGLVAALPAAATEDDNEAVAFALLLLHRFVVRAAAAVPTSLAKSAAASAAFLANAPLSNHAKKDLAEFYFATNAYAKANPLLAELLSHSHDDPRLKQMRDICTLLANKNQTKNSTLLALAAFRETNNYQSTFVSLILNDFNDRKIPKSMRRNIARDLFSPHSLNNPEAAVKLAFLNALFDIADLSATIIANPGASASAEQNVAVSFDDAFASVESNLPHAFYKHFESPTTRSSSVSSILQILSKFGSMLLLSPLGGRVVRDQCEAFTYRLLHKVGTLEAFRGMMKSMGKLDFDGSQRAGWINNASGVSFAVHPFSSMAGASVASIFQLKRKLMTSLTLNDLNDVGRYADVAIPIIVTAAQKFIEKNQFNEARDFLLACPQKAPSGVQVKLLLLICDQLVSETSTAADQIPFTEVYKVLMDFLPQCPQRLALTVALKRCNDESSRFLDSFVTCSEQALQTQLMNTVKLLSVLGKEAHSLDFLCIIQERQIAEVRHLARELVGCLAPGLYEAKFVKDVQAQLVSMLRAAKNPDFIRIVGAVVGGFTCGVQPTGTKVQLRNFGALAFLVCPVEFVAAEDEEWSLRIATLVQNQPDLSVFLKLDGGWLIKFLLSLCPLQLSPPPTTTTALAPSTTFQPSFCLGDLSFSIGDYPGATRHYLHGLSLQSHGFTHAAESIRARAWNARVAQCFQIGGLLLESVVAMQFVAGSGGATGAGI